MCGMPHVLLLLAALSAGPTPVAAGSITLSKTGDAVVTLTVNDGQFPAVTALDIAVDGEVRTTVLIFGKVGHPAYTALLHALPAGKHEVVAQPSPYWAWPTGAAAPSLTVSQAPQSIAIARAPALWVRADTIGTSTDLPLVMYAEDMRVNGTGVLRYSVIFSNEDGGTATPALLARWGRTTDIEMMYEEEWRDGRVSSARYQAPDHKVIEYKGPRDGDHPSLVDATLNNVFLDRGRTAVKVTMVPLLVDLESGTRESVMDKQPWTYQRMADELKEEGKSAVYGDVREYLYVDAKLTLEDAAVAASAKGADGTWRSSDRGMKELAVDRNGWVRIAIPASRNATNVAFQCYPTKAVPGRCRVEVTRVLSLNPEYKPQFLVASGLLEMKTGEMREVSGEKIGPRP
jgi:hypothetical protein